MNLKHRQLKALRAIKLVTERSVKATLLMDALQQVAPVPIEALQGGEAAARTMGAERNPYAPGTQQHEDWAWGYDETRYRIDYQPDPEPGPQ